MQPHLVTLASLKARVFLLQLADFSHGQMCNFRIAGLADGYVCVPFSLRKWGTGFNVNTWRFKAALLPEEPTSSQIPAHDNVTIVFVPPLSNP